jgi:transcription elongation factor Elf1
MSLPDVKECPITCETCGHESVSFLKRDVNGALSLVDRDGDIVYDLVKACRYCGGMFHWHSKEKTLQENAKIYQEMIGLLSELNKPSGRNTDGEQNNSDV